MENKKKLLVVENLKKYFPLNPDFFGKPQSYLRAVDNVSFEVEEGTTIGVVGESGCGKTTLGRTILKLYDTTGGKAIYNGKLIDEFLPKYYVNTIKFLKLYRWKYNHILENKAKAENAVPKTDLSNEDLSKFEVKKAKKVEAINQAIEKILDETSECIGGLLLSTNIEAVQQNLNNRIKSIKIINKSTKKIAKLSFLLENTTEEKKSEIENKISYSKINLEQAKKVLDEADKNIAEIKKEIKSERFEELENKKQSGLNLARLTSSEMKPLRIEIQLIFQDPYSSLPPRMTVGAIISEAVKVHKIVPKKMVHDHVMDVMKKCGLQPQYYDRYAHEFSGGQRQRICIARALAVNPRLIICDEPVSALDVSIQAQIINLLKDLQKKLGLTYVFISHDLSVVKYITTQIMVMYLGNVMEIGKTNEIFENPLHPYTKALFSAVPVPNPDAKMDRIVLKGDIPSPANPPKGCKFHTRCQNCMKVCEFLEPKFVKYDDSHFVSCHLYDEEVLNNREKLEKNYEDYLKEEELKKNEQRKKQK